MADPLDALRQPEAPVAPNPAFASQLRRRLTDLLVPTPPPPGGLRLRPYLVVDGADRAIAFYADVFGARVVGDLIRGDDGRVGHSELEIGGSALFLADAYPEYGIPAPDPAVGVSLHLEVEDADATVARAEAAGSTVLQVVEDRFYGSRSGTIRDPFGHQWQIDAPGTVSTTPAERDEEMAAGGFAYETVDLGRRASVPAAATEPGAPSVGYFTVDAPDPARAASFFGALLGWRARPTDVGFHIENISPPGGIAGPVTTPSVSIFLRVEDVTTAAARVQELGGTVLSETVSPAGTSARCLDDQGVPFDLWQPAPGY